MRCTADMTIGSGRISYRATNKAVAEKEKPKREGSKVFGGGSSHGDGPVETANLTRLGLITENGLTSAGLELFIAAFKAERDARSRNGATKGNLRRIGRLKRRQPGARLT